MSEITRTTTYDGYRLANVTTIFVSPEMILEAIALDVMDNYGADECARIRISPPLQGEKVGMLVSIDPRYPPEIAEGVPEPCYLPPYIFLTDGTGYEEKWGPRWNLPHWERERAQFKSRHGIEPDADLTPDQQARLDELWADRIEEWETAVRAGLSTELELYSPSGDNVTTLEVSYESEYQWISENCF